MKMIEGAGYGPSNDLHTEKRRQRVSDKDDKIEVLYSHHQVVR